MLLHSTCRDGTAAATWRSDLLRTPRRFRAGTRRSGRARPGRPLHGQDEGGVRAPLVKIGDLGLPLLERRLHQVRDVGNQQQVQLAAFDASTMISARSRP